MIQRHVENNNGSNIKHLNEELCQNKRAISTDRHWKRFQWYGIQRIQDMECLTSLQSKNWLEGILQAEDVISLCSDE